MSARHIHRSASLALRTVSAAVMLAVALGLAACGVKSAPKHPEGSTYPREYPASGDAKAVPEDKAKQDGGPPLGTQYDYPNRPPSR
jgi:hypothetical protein